MRKILNEKRKDILYQRFFLFAIFFHICFLFYLAFEIVRGLAINGELNNQALYALISVLVMLLIAQIAYKGSIKNKEEE